MSTAVVVMPGRELSPLIANAGEKGWKRFVEFSTAKIENKNTRDAYARDVRSFFAWCDAHGLTEFAGIEPVHIAALPGAPEKRVRKANREAASLHHSRAL